MGAGPNRAIGRALGCCLGAALVAEAHAQTDPFVERDGRVVFEVESEPAAGDWLKADDIDGHTGEAYYVWNGRNNFGASEAPRGDPIRYHFRVSTPGDYELRWRSRNTVGLEGTEHNDSWVRFPTGRDVEGEHPLGGWTKVYMGQVARWTWDAYTVDGQSRAVRRHFEAGDHFLEIAGRSNGHALDRIALYRYADTAFSVKSFDAFSPSPRASHGSGDTHLYAGGTCVGDTLSLSANRSASRRGEALVETGEALAFDGEHAYALLEFELDRVPLEARSVTLELASVDGPLAVDAYLASDSGWRLGDAADAFPHAAVRLGGVAASTVPMATRSLPLDAASLPRGTVSIVLVGTGMHAGAVHGVGTPLEPRLSVNVASGYCEGEGERPDGQTPPPDPDHEEPSGGGGLEPPGDDEEPSADNADGADDGRVVDEGGVEAVDPVVEEADGERRRAGSGGGVALWLLALLVPVALRQHGRGRLRLRGSG